MVGYSVYKHSQKRGSGFVLGLFFITVFSVRIVLEYFKPEQASYDMNNSVLTVGQYLSIPFVVAGLVLCILSSLLPSLRNKSEIILNNDVISK